ncbi:MAG: YbhB/YbcL family Raf kinase inhibitor-like protein [Verrucomicrobiae bacterium]|nr:YbhB/YbcL family Raf kinase inhibitor-like protein [Verrucomicrobiae bacterium]
MKAFLFIAFLCSCALADAEEVKMKLSSAAFAAGQRIPQKYTGEGADISPPLSWEGAPAGTKSFALICDDPDAVRVAGKVWVHWVIWNIPGTATGLPENVEKKEVVLNGARQGMNSWPRLGYNGPMPPPGHGVHHYHFKLYALDAVLDLPPRATKQQLEAAMKGHILAEAELIGTYEQK